MLENGADWRFLQEILGHARLDTIQIYTKVSIQELEDSIRDAYRLMLETGASHLLSVVEEAEEMVVRALLSDSHPAG
jgi:hypothetical protein